MGYTLRMGKPRHKFSDMESHRYEHLNKQDKKGSM